MRDEAQKRIGQLYPKITITEEMAEDRPDLKGYIGQQLSVVAWLWARTVVSPDPSCNGAHVPIVKSFCLSNKANVWIEPRIDRTTNDYTFRIANNSRDTDKHLTGTVNRKGVKCLLTGTPISFDYVRREGRARRLGIRQLAIIANGNGHRVYLAPISQHDQSVVHEQSEQSVADLEMAANPFSLRPPLYGFHHFSDLFTPRQLRHSILSVR